MTSLLTSTYWLALAAVAFALLVIAFARRIRWIPGWLVRVGLAGLVLIGVFWPRGAPEQQAVPPREVMIVDQSDSIATDVREEALARGNAWLSAAENRLLIAVSVKSVPSISAEALLETSDGRATSLHTALQDAENFLGPEPGRVILVSDGGATDLLEAKAAVDKIISLGHQIDTISLPNEGPNDAYVGALWTPTALWENTPFSTVLPVFMPEAGEAALQLYLNESLSYESVESLPAGQSLMTFDLSTVNEEIMTLKVVALVEGDPRPENNIAGGSIRVFPAPNVLLVSTAPDEVVPFVSALQATGLDVDIVSPADLPDDLNSLAPYQVVVIHNLLAENLTERQMVTLRTYVEDLGRGLLFTGGRNSYTLGGYKNTILEGLLPVKLEPPIRSDHAPVTFVVVLDRSNSMSPQRAVIKPLDLAKEAALRSVETLKPEDYFGFMAYSETPTWVVEVTSLSGALGLREIQDDISRITASGGTRIYLALETAVDALIDPITETRHVLLLSDGQSDETINAFTELASRAHEEGITISTIALGADADQVLMEAIAEAGQGRFYPVLEPQDLPRILVTESEAARAENTQLGETNLVSGPECTAAMEAGLPCHPILSNTLLAQIGIVEGYNALTSRANEGAEDVLVSASFGDPVLSVWQYGLGRVVAWTSDLGENWAAGWGGDTAQGQLFSRVIRYALPDPAFSPDQVNVQVGPTEVTVTAALQTATGIPINGIQVVYSYADENGEIKTYPLSQQASGTYGLTLDRPPEGVYRGVVSYKLPGDTVRTEIAAPMVVNVPEEWRPADPKRGRALLASWAESSEGEVIDWGDLQNPDLIESPVEDASKPDPRLNYLLLALIVFWPIEIALRRRWMPWR